MNVYIGLFLICFSGLAIEITFVRLLSVTTWYHLAFFAISTAMLGMTAGATRVYLSPQEFEKEKLYKALSKYSIYFALSVPATLSILCLIPLDVSYRSVMIVVSLIVTTAACSLPFYFSGIIVSAALTKSNLPIGKLYASDLIGAALGCLLVLGGMEMFDASSLIILSCGPILISAILFSWKENHRSLKTVAAIFLILYIAIGIINSSTSKGIRPLIIKGSRIEPSSIYYREKWNSFSRIAVYEPNYGPPPLYGSGKYIPDGIVEQYRMNIDGEAATVVTKFDSLKDIEYLKYDVTGISYRIAPKGPACIIGIGGGRDIQTACAYQHKPITAVEINPIFVSLLQNEFRDFAGIANNPDVNIVTAEARSYLSQSNEKYSIIQMSLIDTWAATGAGAFSLSENALYTVEAWKVFLNRMDENGVFSVSRWHSAKDIGETGRVLSLAVETLFQLGEKNPSENLAMISAGNISTLIISRNILNKNRVSELLMISEELGFKTICAPEHPPEDILLSKIVASHSSEELNKAIEGSRLNYTPPTDENPYFFNMLRLSNLWGVSGSKGIIGGNLHATLTLIALLMTLLVLAIATVVIPLRLKKRFLKNDNQKQSSTLWSGAFYFSLIGCGFMLTEIALIQRLTVLLSHPIYALGILLFTLILSTGFGSMISDKLPLTKKPWIYIYPVLTSITIIVLSIVLNYILSSIITEPLTTKILVSIAVIFPTGMLMGLFFPAGMRLVNYVTSSDTPWYWALNGIFGVLCSAIAVLISIYIGISTNFYLAAGCYAVVIVAQIFLLRNSERQMSNVKCQTSNVKRQS